MTADEERKHGAYPQRSWTAATTERIHTASHPGVTAFNSTASANNLTITNSGTIDGSSSGKAIDFGSGNNSLTVTGGSASILGNITGGTGTNTVTIDPGAGNTFSYAGVMSNISSVEDKSGTVILTGANTYTGDTTISGGTTYVNNITGSGTGTGKVAVSTGAAFGGSGIVQSGSGNDIMLAGGSTLISGGIQSGTSAGHGLTLDNTVAQGTILDASIGSANLTFYLGAGTTAGAGPNTFGTPNNNSSYATVLGDIANELKFATGDTITLTDLTSGNLQLNLSIPYLLIQAGSNADYSGLTTTGGVVGGVAQNGYVTNLTLLGNTTGEYAGAKLYLFNGKLEAEAVPEPSSWLLSCLAAAIFVLIRRRQLKS